MPDDVPVFPDRFRGVARYYTAGRPIYPARLADRVAALVGGLAEGRVLDLGTGPGFLALDFARHAAELAINGACQVARSMPIRSRRAKA